MEHSTPKRNPFLSTSQDPLLIKDWSNLSMQTRHLLVKHCGWTDECKQMDDIKVGIMPPVVEA